MKKILALVLTLALCLGVAATPACADEVRTLNFWHSITNTTIYAAFEEVVNDFNNGIGAEVAGEVILVGSLGFVRSMGVHMPAGTRVRQAVYVSVDGELAGIFAVKYKPSPSTRKGLRDVLANRSFSVVLATRDFLITPELIGAKYELDTQSVIFPPLSERLRLSAIDPEKNGGQGGLIAKDTFGAFASTVAAGRTLKSVSGLSLALSLAAGVLGWILCTLLLVWNSAQTASPLHLAAFQLVWACLNWLFSFVLLRF